MFSLFSSRAASIEVTNALENVSFSKLKNALKEMNEETECERVCFYQNARYWIF